MIPRVITGIEGLDAMLKGGVPQHSAVLVVGPPGTGKTTLGLQAIYTGATRYNEPGLVVTFEEFPDQMYRDALEIGMDLKALEHRGMLRTIFTSPEVFKQELEKPMGLISETVNELGCKRIFIDSVSHFRRVSNGQPSADDEVLTSLVNGLKREKLTSFFTYESLDLLGDQHGMETRMAYIVDTLVFMKYVEIDSEIQRALFVLKSRGTDHDKEIRQYDIAQGGIQVRGKFEDREGLLGGGARRSFKSGFVQAFRRGT